MEAVGVLMTSPVDSYLEQELDKRFNLFRYWIQAKKREFLSQHAGSIRAVVGNSADSELIEALPKLEIISSFSVGLDNIDLIKCQERGIMVTNTPDVLADDLADLAIGLMLAVLRRICVCDQFVRGGGWKFGDFKLTTRLTGKRVGIIGLGRIGLGIAKRAEAFDCTISYHTRSKNPDTPYTHYSSVVQLASNCDILVVACPLTPDTMHIINREVINALGAKGVLINISRRAHVDEPELVSALADGCLGGAGLNVFENEPHVPDQLLGLDKVVLLPHVGGGNVMTHRDMAELVLGNLEAHFTKKPLLTTPVV